MNDNDNSEPIDVLQGDRLRWEGNDRNPHFNVGRVYQYEGTYYNQDKDEEYVKLEKGAGIVTHLPAERFVDMYKNWDWGNMSKELRDSR